jgi:hypothetical protein
MTADAAQARGAQRLMISQRMQRPRAGAPTDLIGRWVGAGAINDGGTARITQAQVTDQSDGTALVETTYELTSEDVPDQMLVLRSLGTLRPFPPPPPKRRGLVEGTWRLVSATGAYANLRANGRFYETITDGEIDDPPQEIREITLVRSGRARVRSGRARRAS